MREHLKLAAAAGAMIVLIITLLLVLFATMAHASTGHSPLVTITCTVGTDGQAADVVIRNDQDHGTGWMHGYHVAAVAKDGDILNRTETVSPFKVPGHSQIGSIEPFQPRHLASCTATILWGK